MINAPLETKQRFTTGPPVQEPPLIGLEGIDGWPSPQKPGNATPRQAERAAMKRTAPTRTKKTP